MVWILEAVTLLVVAFVLRRLLRMTPRQPHFYFSMGHSGPESETLYSEVASEFKTHTTILAVALNDAFEEYKRGHSEVAWPLIRLCDDEWSHLAEQARTLQNLSFKYLPTVRIPLPMRNLDAHEFRSRTMIEYVRLYGVLDQFVFRSKLRFQLHLRLLRRATGMLSEEFHRASGEVTKDAEPLSQILAQLDLYFHDLDMIAKETLLGFRSLLNCLPDSALTEIAEEAQTLLLSDSRNDVARATF